MHMHRRVSAVLVMVGLSWGLAGNVCAGVKGPFSLDLEVHGRLESFSWKETSPDGDDDWVEESGAVFGIGGGVRPDPMRLSLQGKGEFYFGEVDYDGYIQSLADGTMIPYEDKTEYIGGLLTLDVTMPVHVSSASQHAFHLFAGGGFEGWDRELGQDNPEYGYTESWAALSFRVGASLFLLGADAKKRNAYISGGISYPFFIEESIDFDSDDDADVDVEPEGNWGPFVEIGLRYDRLFLEAFYEYMLFDQSDSEIFEQLVTIDPPSGNPYTVLVPVEVFQPESERRRIGIRAGVYF